MTLDDSIQGFRLRVVREAQRSGNVSATCRRYDVSRTVFYRWRARLARYGPDGLHPTRRTARPGRAPQLSVADERRVIAEALAWPTRGPQWVSDRLALQGLVVAPVTAWRVLRRVGLNHRLARLAVLEDQSATRGLLTERTARRRRGRHVAAAQPGDLCSLDSFYIGKLKGVGKVWQLTACDCASSFGWARIVVGEVTAARMAAFLTDVVRPGYRAAGWRLKRVLTDNGKEFKASFVTTCADRQVRHTRTKPRHAWTNGFVERLQGTMLHEHWRVEFRRHYFRSARALQRSLDRFLVFYNTQRPHRGYRLQGRTPATVFHGAVAACTSTPASPDRAGVRSEHVDGTVNTIPELDSLGVMSIDIWEELRALDEARRHTTRHRCKGRFARVGLKRRRRRLGPAGGQPRSRLLEGFHSARQTPRHLSSQQLQSRSFTANGFVDLGMLGFDPAWSHRARYAHVALP